MTQAVMPLADDVHEIDGDIGDVFTLDLRVIEDGLPFLKMNCNTNDNCGNTTCNSACVSNAAQAPF